MKEKILKKLPGFNCGSCGYKNCAEFAHELIGNKVELRLCPVLAQERFNGVALEITEILSGVHTNNSRCYTGVIDGYEADIELEPLPGESSCREVLMPFIREELVVGDTVEYRPLGCPIVHYAKIIATNGKLITVNITGPCKRLGYSPDYKEIGCCMVISFEGTYSGKRISVGETVRFLPKHCMMQKVHSGVVVNIESNKVLIEGIDLKVWHLPVLSS
jgi:hypothetical protein